MPETLRSRPPESMPGGGVLLGVPASRPPTRAMPRDCPRNWSSTRDMRFWCSRAMPAMSATMRATAARAAIDRTRLVRSDQVRQPRGRTSRRLGAGHPQRVPDPAHGVDQRRAGTVDLAAQVVDVRLDDASIATEVVVPDPVEDLRLADHPPRVGEQVAQQVELGGGQVDELAAAAHLVGVLVHLQVGVAQDTAVGQERLGPAAAQDGAEDRKSTRLNSSHLGISYAVFCLKKKKSNDET